MIWLVLLLAQSSVDTAVLSRGEKIFAQNCSVGYCHGAAGAAGRGPRLRGRTFDRIYLIKVTRDGIPSSAMPAWKGRLTDEEISAVVAYVMSLASASAEPPPANPMPPGVGPAAVSEFKGPAQAARGHALFFDAVRDAHCGTCHSLGGRGIAIGPDLVAIAAKSPKEIAAAMRSTRSQHVLTVRLKDGETFPALRVEQAENWIKLYDLTSPPPVLRTFERSEVESLTENPHWSHAALAKDFSPAEVADIVAYLKWAAAGETNGVKATDLR